MRIDAGHGRADGERQGLRGRGAGRNAGENAGGQYGRPEVRNHARLQDRYRELRPYIRPAAPARVAPSARPARLLRRHAIAGCPKPYTLAVMPERSEAARRYSTSEMLERLVAFDTTSSKPNLDLIGFVRDYFDAHGVPYRVSTDETGHKANLHAVVGPQEPGGVALSGHVDTVPVEGQAWTSDPHRLRRENGRWYARGAADMKGFVASALAAAPELQARGLARPMHLFISYDEETTCNGARRLIEDLRESGLRPAFCVVGEPSGMQPVLAHKGRLAMRVRVRGLPGHSSELGHGVNAVHAAAEAVAWVASEARRFQSDGPFEEGFDPPHTTIHVGTFQGGTSLNIIPERAEFVMEWRTIPADDFFREIERMKAFVGATIEPAMKQVDPGSRLRLRRGLLDSGPVAASGP